MYQPCVVEVGGAWRYRMWFFGWATGGPGADAIYHARSNDLKHWEVYSGGQKWDTTMSPKIWKPVLSAGDQWYDNWHNGDPSVVWKDGSFTMAYSASGKLFEHSVAGFPNNMVLSIMGATSPDGIHWKKTERPLLIRDGDSRNPQPDPGRIGDFNRPCLTWENGRWKMWFDYWIPGKGCCLGCAENASGFSTQNGFRVQHDLAKPLLENWVNPEVIKIGDTYHLSRTRLAIRSNLE